MDRAVGCIGCGYGYQGPGMVLAQLRSITHALRGWPVPLGVAINSAVIRFENGKCTDPGIAKQLEIMARQVVDFAGRQIGGGHCGSGAGDRSGPRRQALRKAVQSPDKEIAEPYPEHLLCR